jgi:DNA adenine methylase Dam
MIETPFNYTGSKYKLLPQILPILDYSKPYFIDLFCGGGSIYTNILDKYEKVIANDIINDLIGIHRSLLESDDIIDETKSLCPGKSNKEGFLSLRENYNSNKSSAKLWALMLSSTNNMMRFNQKFKYNQTYGERGWNSNTDKKVEIFTNHIRNYKDKIRFISKSFNDVEVTSDKVMIYADPPYSNTEAGYNAYWKKDDDVKLYNYLKEIDNIGSSFMISGVLKHDNKSCFLLDKLISDGYNVINLNYDYNKVSRKGDKETKEVIITNYDIKK